LERPNPAGIHVWGKPDEGVGSVFHTLSRASNRPARGALVVQAEVDLVELDVHPGDPELLLQQPRVLAADGARRREQQAEASGRPSLSRMPSPSESVQPVLVRSRAAWPLS